MSRRNEIVDFFFFFWNEWGKYIYVVPVDRFRIKEASCGHMDIKLRKHHWTHHWTLHDSFQEDEVQVIGCSGAGTVT